MLMQICRALDAAHKKGIVHRDMKPENVFITERDENPEFVKVLDFGIAKLLEEAEGGRKNLTLLGTAMGTPRYMSPEQSMGLEIGRRTDIYAVGVIMYEMLCSAVPFDDENPMQILQMQINQAPVLPSVLRPDLGIALDVEAIIMKALEKDPTGYKKLSNI